MKKLLLCLALGGFLFSCSATRDSLNEQPVEIQKFDRDEYIVLDNIKGEAKSVKFWFLFIPFGGKNESELAKEAYQNALDSAGGKNADGILQPKYTYKKSTVPLILFNWTKREVKANGKAFRIKTEQEYQESK